MRPHRLLAPIVLVMALATPLAVAGEAWRAPLPDIRVLLPYAATYTVAGSTRTHTGVDLAAEAGEAVRAVAPGTVSFCGYVPSAAGGRMLAVTLALDDGSAATFLPLARSDVSKGERVGAGQRLGDLAAEGDASSPDTHLHLGVTRNGAHLDPLTLLPHAMPAPAEPDPSPSPDPSPAPSTPPAPAPAPAAAVASRDAPRVAVDKPSTAEAPASAKVRASGRQDAEVSPTTSHRAEDAWVAQSSVGGRGVAAAPGVSPVEALLPLSARLALEEERAVPVSRLPDAAAVAKVRALALGLAVRLAAGAAALLAMLGLARARRAEPELAMARGSQSR